MNSNCGCMLAVRMVGWPLEREREREKKQMEVGTKLKASGNGSTVAEESSALFINSEKDAVVREGAAVNGVKSKSSQKVAASNGNSNGKSVDRSAVAGAGAEEKSGKTVVKKGKTV